MALRKSDFSDGKQNIISALLQEYDIQSADDIQDVLNNVIKKLAAYVILGINEDGLKEVISLQIGQNESSKYWLGVLNELKNRGVQDILILCADGLSGRKEAVNTAFPATVYQRCIVHQARNTLKYVSDKDKKKFATDLKTIYQATSKALLMKGCLR